MSKILPFNRPPNPVQMLLEDALRENPKEAVVFLIDKDGNWCVDWSDGIGRREVLGALVLAQFEMCAADTNARPA